MAVNTVPLSLKPFRIALVQLGQVTPDKSKNLNHAREMIMKAAAGEGATKPDLIVLPECFNSPYGVMHFPVYAETIGFTSGVPYDMESSESESVKMLSGAARETEIWLVGGSIPERDKSDSSKLYNTCTVYSPKGELVVIHRKVHLFDMDIPGKITFKESETLTGGSAMNMFDTPFARIGLGICYDVRFPELAMIAARNGCQVIIYPAAFNMITGPLHWEMLHRARAVDNQVFMSMCSPARDNATGYQAYGHSMVVDPMGTVLTQAGHLEEIVYADIDPAIFHSARAGIPVTTQRRFDVYPDVSREARVVIGSAGKVPN
ncbi:carbon-nitrogen hydrolase [Neolentinus lepideus HHB14362 ss-1]|uniref:Carbon-nitrogen hydrolase n=1 Tax=Neolentinus lepideus HHB14362 ss-1 TaxID=1314782 RepID=A0A165QVC2_9AGAM|nr:carbon-nitrogen hydrolase [Neolentinus lepideus HHB14362 ss-1]